MPVLAFLLTVVIWPPFYGAMTAPRWCVLAIGVAFLIRPRERIGYVAVFLSVAALSLLWTSNVFNGLDVFIKFAILAAIFYSARPEDSESVFIAMGAGFAINAAFAIAQAFGLDLFSPFSQPSGLFYNKNFLAEAAAPVLVYLLYNRRWLYAAGPAVCVALPMARGPLIGLGLAAIVWAWTRSKALALLLIFGAFSALSAMLATGWRLESATQRIAVWKDALGSLTWFGNGLGSAITVYEPWTHLHNDALEMVYELGIGAVAFFAVLVFAFKAKMPAERLVLVVLLGESFFGFPLHMPTTGFLLAFTAGVLCCARRRVLDSVADSRVVLPSGYAGDYLRRRAF